MLSHWKITEYPDPSMDSASVPELGIAVQHDEFIRRTVLYKERSPLDRPPR
jgi:hypothetical protein